MNSKDALLKFDYIDSLVLELNVENSIFQKKLIEAFPEIESDIRSSSINSNCSCRQKVIDTIWSNMEKVTSILMECYNSGTITFNLKDIEEKYKKEDISGKVAKTSIKEWPNFIDNLKKGKYEYSAFHLVKENDDIFVFFS